jgi:hypothetical protein
MQSELMQTPADSMVPARRWTWPLSLATAAVALLLGLTIALWAHYGTAVFYETILAGIAACM